MLPYRVASNAWGSGLPPAQAAWGCPAVSLPQTCRASKSPRLLRRTMPCGLVRPCMLPAPNTHTHRQPHADAPWAPSPPAGDFPCIRVNGLSNGGLAPTPPWYNKTAGLSTRQLQVRAGGPSPAAAGKGAGVQQRWRRLAASWSSACCHRPTPALSNPNRTQPPPLCRPCLRHPFWATTGTADLWTSPGPTTTSGGTRGTGWWMSRWGWASWPTAAAPRGLPQPLHGWGVRCGCSWLSSLCQP